MRCLQRVYELQWRVVKDAEAEMERLERLIEWHTETARINPDKITRQAAEALVRDLTSEQISVQNELNQRIQEVVSTAP